MSGSETAHITLETGHTIEGRARAPGETRGEVVFTTAYTGYEESLTDPSYTDQILTFAYPLIGNYGVREERFESPEIQPRAVIARELTDAVADWCAREGIPAVDRVDTRDLVTHIRDNGAMGCGIAVGACDTQVASQSELEASTPLSTHTDIGNRATVSSREIHGESNTGSTIALLDCGVKRSIIEEFVSRNAVVHQLPVTTPVGEISALDPDVVFISNGPGNPETYTNALKVARTFLDDLPLAGICLGQQIIALATGGATAKMDFGHRGVNQPVYDTRTDRVVMTTQNHGYAVTDPGVLSVTQHNVNDGSAEGLATRSNTVLTRQYHPEANPGPQDTLSFFDDVLDLSVE